MDTRKRLNLIRSAGMSLFIVTSTHVALGQTTLQSIDFRIENGKALVQIKSDGKIEFKKQENTADQQFVLELKDTQLGPIAKREIPTVSMDGPIVLIRPYQKGPDARVVFQLRENSSPTLQQDKNNIEIGFPLMPVVSAAAPVSAQTDVDSLVQAEKSLDSKSFSGSPITIKVRDADVRDVLRLIGEASGFNLIIGDDVKGEITLSLADVPWDQALDVVLNTKQLGAERNNSILRITTLVNQKIEKTAIYEAKMANQQAAPRVTRIFKVSYATLDDIKGVLTTFSKSNGGAVSATNPAAVVEIDKRTNSIIVQDIASNMDRISKLIELLDTQTPQVLVEAKIVEASEGFSNSMDGNLGVQFGKGAQKNSFGSFNGGVATDVLISDPATTTQSDRITGASAKGGAFGTTFGMGFVGLDRLNTFLSLTESENKSKTISSPRTVVLNKEKANILSTIPILFDKVTTTSTGTTTEKIQVDANVGLTVTPTVTNDESVLLDLLIQRDIPKDFSGTIALAKRNIATKVVVENGATLVIGGLYDVSQTNSGYGFPLLRKIPVLGLLFGGTSDTVSRTELFIFITPQIINSKKSGIAGT
jgi:type IV pilus assembly protein PilQ